MCVKLEIHKSAWIQKPENVIGSFVLLTFQKLFKENTRDFSDCISEQPTCLALKNLKNNCDRSIALFLSDKKLFSGIKNELE